MSKFLDNNGVLYLWQKIKAAFVAKESGKGLSTNDYTTTEKNKLAGIAAGATANTGTITGIKMNGASKGTSGEVDLGTVLTAHQTIKQDGVTGATVNRFGTCSTAAGTAAKAVDITTGTFTLEAGARVSVKFTNANTASTPTLNVESKGAKNIFHKGAKITSGSNKALLAGVVDFIYDGTQWHLIGNYVDTDTDTKVTSVGNHYTPTTATVTLPENGQTVAVSGIAYVNHSTLQTDAAGHVVEFSEGVGFLDSEDAASGGTTLSLVTTGEKATWNAKSNLALGTSSTTAAKGNHTHALSIATDTGTNELTLAHGSKYKITAGGDSFVFTMPASGNTDTKVTSAANHYAPSADSNSELTAEIDGDAGAYAKNTEYTVLTGVKAQRDAKGHVTGLTYTAQKIKDTNDNTKVTSAANHYAPAEDDDAELTAALSGTAGAYALNTEYTVLTGVKAQRDAKGHVTGLTYTAQKVKDTNTTYSAASQSANGLMSSADKKKLDAFGAADTYALKTDLTGLYKYKGTKATVSALPTSGNTAGDVWDVQSDGMNYAWNGSAWDALGATFTIDSITNGEIDEICV